MAQESTQGRARAFVRTGARLPDRELTVVLRGPHGVLSRLLAEAARHDVRMEIRGGRNTGKRS